MAYQSITTQILEVIQESTQIIQDIYLANDEIQNNPSKKDDIIDKFKKSQKDWCIKTQNILINNNLLLEREDFINYSDSALSIEGFNSELNEMLNFMKDRKSLIIKIAKEIESKQKKEVVILKIDDFDNFKEIIKVKSSEVSAYAEDCFLEDDVEEAFLEKLEEPFKEFDGGAETRDLFTDRLKYNSKRLSTAFMFKGRGQKGELTIKKSGTTGNQLLKLAKNNSAECFIVQHINKISTDVREALQDHVLQSTRLSKVYLCFIDGVDTARFLKSIGKDLEVLKKK